MLSLELVQKALPANLKNSATQQLVDRINSAVADPLIAEQIRENFISYTGVLRDGKFKTEDYLSAVMYVSFKLMGDSNQDAYFKTFPQRYQDLLARGASPKDISSYVTAYNKGKLVNLILEQSLVPVWVLNQHSYQAAINTQVELMTDVTVSPKVRSDAANSILTHLKKPETNKASLDININENSGMNELRETLRRVGQAQLDSIAGGHQTAREIAAMPLIEGTAKEVEG